jgi:hypothetical protein
LLGANGPNTAQNRPAAEKAPSAFALVKGAYFQRTLAEFFSGDFEVKEC